MKSTIAETIVKMLNESRCEDINVDAGFEFAINQSIGKIKFVKIAHREIYFNDGSVIFTLDHSQARKAGLSDFDYAYKAQGKIC